MSVSSGWAVSTMTRSAESSGTVSRMVFQARRWQVEVYVAEPDERTHTGTRGRPTLIDIRYYVAGQIKLHRGPFRSMEHFATFRSYDFAKIINMTCVVVVTYAAESMTL